MEHRAKGTRTIESRSRIKFRAAQFSPKPYHYVLLVAGLMFLLMGFQKPENRITINGQSPPPGTVITCTVLEDGWQCDDGTDYKHPKPFDIPPTETERQLPMFGGMEPPVTTYIDRECADKTRFLLMSQDGQWHCLALAK